MTRFGTDLPHAPRVTPGLSLTGASIRRGLTDITVYALLAILLMAGVVMAQSLVPAAEEGACVFAFDMETGQSLSGACSGLTGR